MLTRQENDLLTQTGTKSAMGQYFRRFWQPVALAEELPEPDCAPLRLKVMGEDLVAFRDTKGRLGLLMPTAPIAAQICFSDETRNAAYVASIMAGNSMWMAGR